MKFQHEDNRIFAQSGNGQTIAEITFPSISGSRVNIDHTYVDSSLRGQGIADKLMQAAVAELREKNLKAIATCSYAKVWFDSHPGESDLISD